MNDGLFILICLIGLIPAAFLIALSMVAYERTINFIKNKTLSTKTEYVEDVGWYWKRITRSDGYVIFQDTIPKTEYIDRKKNEIRTKKLERIILDD